MVFGPHPAAERRQEQELVKVDGEQQPANFIVGYEDGKGPHCLTLDKYGQGLLCEGERWVLLEPEQADDNE